MSDDHKCWNCRHWIGKSPKEWGACRLTYADDGEAVVKSSMAVAYDTESYHAHLTTAPGFGCNQWEQRAE